MLGLELGLLLVRFRGFGSILGMHSSRMASTLSMLVLRMSIRMDSSSRLSSNSRRDRSSMGMVYLVRRSYLWRWMHCYLY